MASAAPLGVIGTGYAQLYQAVSMGSLAGSGFGVAKVTFCAVCIKTGGKGVYPVAAGADWIGRFIKMATTAVQSGHTVPADATAISNP